MRYLPLLLSLSFASAISQTLTEGLEQTYELQTSVSQGNTPLWLNANRYGLSSLQSCNGYVRGRVERPIAVDSLKQWGIGYGLDVAVPYHYTSHIVLQQAFTELRYRRLHLTLGQKQQPMALHSATLSTGAQTLGINARPVPGLRLELPSYWSIPATHDWLSLRGHLFYGMMTDGNFQQDWTEGQYRYSQDVLLHTKAGYLRIGPENEAHPYSLELGLEMACQFGGTLYHTSQGTLQGKKGARAFLDAFLATGSDEVDAVYHNVGGNQLGSWVARFNYQGNAFGVSLYADHYFEDHSSMFLTDYDGYGEGEDWDDGASNRFLIYPVRDILVGAEVRLLHCSWLQTIVIEGMNTRYQSGPIYHDHNPGLSDHIGGDDNYYNHYLYQGWSHWGQVIGNPLYRSPLYNTDHTLTIQSNRFYAWHFGFEGAIPTSAHQPLLLDYRLLSTWQHSLGTYQQPLLSPQQEYSLLAEVTASFAPQSRWSPYSLRFAYAFDRGALLGDNQGLQFTFIFHLP